MASFTAVAVREENVYVATCPEDGTASQGGTIEEAVSNLRAATELYLEEFPVTHEGRSFVTTFEVSGVADA